MECGKRLVEAQLVTSRLLLRLAAELLKQAMILIDGRLPSWKIIGNAYEKTIEAYVELEIACCLRLLGVNLAGYMLEVAAPTCKLLETRGLYPV